MLLYIDAFVFFHKTPKIHYNNIIVSIPDVLVFPERATPCRLVLEPGQTRHGLGTGHTHPSEVHIEDVCEPEIMETLEWG